jgi:maleate cis-trans isomerase
VTDHHIGMIVPSSNLTMETELPRMMRQRESVVPEDRFVFHSSRIRMQHVTPEQLRAMNAQTERAALELADAAASACGGLAAVPDRKGRGLRRGDRVHSGREGRPAS